MNENILRLFEQINSLLWVYDIEKVKPLIDKASIILEEKKDPLFKKILQKYKDTYDEINAPQLDFYIDDTESKGTFYSNEVFSMLILIRNKYEADIRIVTDEDLNIKAGKCSEELVVVDPGTEEQIFATKVEESDSCLVYDLKFQSVSFQFGEITFTESGAAEGKLYASNLEQLELDETNSIFELFLELAAKVYRISPGRDNKQLGK